MKNKVILIGPCISEFGWETLRFCGILPYFKKVKYKNQKDIKYIILTRKERFDLYGNYADILIPLKIEGDYLKYQPNCFRLNNYSIEEYNNIVKRFRKQYEEKYQIIEHVYPKIENKQWMNKNQFPNSKMNFNFKSRQENINLINEFLKNNEKKIIILSPRYREGFRRNWKQWPQFYDLIYEKKLNEKYNFIICGLKGEYVEDKNIQDDKKRLLDINDIELNKNSSLVGLLLVLLEKAILTVGSQSAIPNLSLLCQCPVLEFGDQGNLHSKIYNIKKTKIEFIDDLNYSISFEKLFKKMNEILKKSE